jgi:hypothetical protein
MVQQYAYVHRAENSANDRIEFCFLLPKVGFLYKRNINFQVLKILTIVLMPKGNSIPLQGPADPWTPKPLA